MTEQNSFGINTSGDAKLNWKNLNSNHDDDPIVSALMNLASKKFIDKIDESSNNILSFDSIWVEQFNIFLKNNKLETFIDIKSVQEIINTPKVDDKNNKKKVKKEKPLTKSELIQKNIEEEKQKKEIDDFLKRLIINNNYPQKKNKTFDAFLNIIYWSLYIIKNHSNNNVNMDILLDNAISLYRAINECNNIIDEHIKDASYKILDKLEKIISKKNKNYYELLINKYFELISSCWWDKNKINSIRLYEEQIELITKILDSLNKDEPLLLFYWVPPANGKTLICTILTKLISHYNNTNQKKEGFKRKSVLYICYNDIVRNSVSNLCVTHNIDIKFWFAMYHADMYDQNIKLVDLRPYKNCFPDWRKPKSAALSKKDEKNAEHRFSPNVRIQWNQYLDETRLHSQRMTDIKDPENASNIPEMVISDLDSALILLKEFPDMFIPYFDEAFAASNEMVTAQIMSVLPKRAILVSATLAEKEQIPNILNKFKLNHSLDNDNFIHYIKNNRQHINCDFISPEGSIIAPHHKVSNIDELKEFIEILNKHPVIQRGYSNKIVYEMYIKLKDILPVELDLKTRFNYLGLLTNESLRNYGIDLVKFVSNNEDFFNLIKQIKIDIINDNSLENMLSKNSFFYNDKNTLHVSNQENFHRYIVELTNELLLDAPKLKNLIKSYEKDIESIKDKIEKLTRNNKNGDNDEELGLLSDALGTTKIVYPSKNIFNSYDFLCRYSTQNKISNYNKILFDFEVINNLDDTYAKLFLSSIGVYNQKGMNMFEIEVFLRYKDQFKFILSDPSIVYGTNINLNLIDIEESMKHISTKNTLYQLIGRAGRIGKSSSASVIIRSWDLFNIIIENNNKNIEAEHIEKNMLLL